MDLSDGLSIDLHRLCLASGVTADLTGEIPVFPGATVDEALHGGEDYELLFTTPSFSEIPAEAAGVPLTCIGVIRRGRPGAVRLHGRPLPPLGWDHFHER
jgi:thiamine-monophosphate kinase